MQLTGCATERTLPEWRAVTLDEQVVRPSNDCQWPDIQPATVSGIDGGFLDADALQALTVCREVSGFHYELAGNNADSADALLQTIDLQNQQGRLYNEIAEFQLEQMRQDKRDAELEAWVYKIASILIAGAAL